MKQLVVLWSDSLRELDLSTEFGGKGVVQQLGDWSLPAVVIDFQRVKCIGPDGTRIKELAIVPYSVSEAQWANFAFSNFAPTFIRSKMLQYERYCKDILS